MKLSNIDFEKTFGLDIRELKIEIDGAKLGVKRGINKFPASTLYYTGEDDDDDKGKPELFLKNFIKKLNLKRENFDTERGFFDEFNELLDDIASQLEVWLRNNKCYLDGYKVEVLLGKMWNLYTIDIALSRA